MTRWFALAALLAVIGCLRPPERPTERRPATAANWLCRPDRPNDPCDSSLASTEIRADGSQVIVNAAVRAPHPKVDCFYVYPTVDLDLVPGNHTDLGDTDKPRRATLDQAARFRETCALWVPLYRQVTIGTYLQSPDELEKKLAIAYADIDVAFREFLAQSDPSHQIVLVGHSQGAEMIVRVIKHFFDDDPALRARLLLAMPIGGDVDVASGTSFGTSKSIPPCTQPMETGCLVAYRTYARGEEIDPSRWAPPPGHATVCVDPSALDRPPGAPEPHALAGSIFESTRIRGMSGKRSTAYTTLPGYYEAHCQGGPAGFAYLAVNEPANDARKSPFDLHDRRFRFGKLGLHIFDMQFTQRDLVDLVVRRAAAL